jgi:hypothetical protein
MKTDARKWRLIVQDHAQKWGAHGSWFSNRGCFHGGWPTHCSEQIEDSPFAKNAGFQGLYLQTLSLKKTYAKEEQQKPGGEATKPPLLKSHPNYWLSEFIPAGHDGGAGAGLIPLGSDWMTPEASEQKLRCPVVPTFTGHAMIV